MIKNSEMGNPDRIGLHSILPPVFSTRQRTRFRRSRRYIRKSIDLYNNVYPDKHPIIYEMGCASLDISGLYSQMADIYGVDCNPGFESIVKERHPDCKFILADIETFTPPEMDILVLCEVLEHLLDPSTFLKRLLPISKYVVITHPIDMNPDGNVESQHYWTFNNKDFEGWFYDNNYRILMRNNFYTSKSKKWFQHLVGLGEKE